MSIVNRVGRQHLRGIKRPDNKSRIGCDQIHTADLETVVYQQMVKKLESYKMLTGRQKAVISYCLDFCFCFSARSASVT
jgi:site-specific DNA recombinase